MDNHVNLIYSPVSGLTFTLENSLKISQKKTRKYHQLNVDILE